MRRHTVLSCLPLLLAVVPLLGGLPAPLSAQQLTAAEVRERAASPEGLAGADLHGAILPGFAFDNLVAPRSIWDQADLRGASFQGGDFTEASLVGATLRGATLERVDFSDAKLTGADFTGAQLRQITAVGADLQGVKLRGAQVDNLRLSPPGDHYLSALALALDHLSGVLPSAGKSSVGWAAGLSSLAFGFVYDPADWGRWPGTPVFSHPLVTALQTAGAEVALRHKLNRGEAFWQLSRGMRDRAACLLALDLAAPGESGDGLATPVWGLAQRFEGEGEAAICVVAVPPFGELSLAAEELSARWGQVFPTLLPVGQKPVDSPYALVVAMPGKLALTRQQVGLSALREGVRVLIAPSPRAELVTGVAGLGRLLADAQAAAEKWDLPRLEELARWGSRSRQDLAGARQLAADFLGELAALLPAEPAAQLNQAATTYRAEAYSLRQEWVDLNGLDLSMRETLTPAVQQDVQVLAQALAAEQQALALLQQVAGAAL